MSEASGERPYVVRVNFDILADGALNLSEFIGIEVDRIMRQGIGGKTYKSVLITTDPPPEGWNK